MKVHKNILYTIIVSLAAGLFICTGTFAQQTDDVGAYLDELGKPSEKILAESWEYMSAASHSKNPRAIENKRLALVKTINEYISIVKKMKPFLKDDSLRQTVLKYLNTLLIVTNKDYAKLVDMKEVAEQSYDLFEAYILAEKKANEKLQESAEFLKTAEQNFAAKYNVNLVFTETDTSRKIKKGAETINYYNKVHLILFKPLKQEAYLLEAERIGDIGKVEQNRKTLSKNAADALKLLASVEPYEGDRSIISACENCLKFYLMEADEKTTAYIDFLMKKDDMEKRHKAIKALNESERTKETIDAFNEKVSEFNQTVKTSNAITMELNEQRATLINNWNKAMSEFIDGHVPK
jgi:hypothetical protein